MNMTIHATDLGPLFFYEDKFIALTNDDEMIQMCYENATYFLDIQNHIKEELENTFQLYLEAFMADINPPASKLYAYISAMQQFWIFKHIKFAQFITTLEQAEEQ